MHEHADARLASELSRLTIRACLLGAAGTPALEHGVDEPIALDVQTRLVDAGERVSFAVFADAGRPHREARARRRRVEPRIRRKAPDLVVGRVAGDREAVGDGEPSLLQPRAVERLAAHARQIARSNRVECLQCL